MRKREYSVSGERTVYTYSYLYSAANFVFEQANKAEEGSLYNCMSSMVLTAFCIEAYLNHIGSMILSYWDDEIKKGLSIKNKLKIICHHLDLVPDFSERPFKSFNQIMRFRNKMAHATSEKLSCEGVQTIREGERIKYPEAWWEKECNTKIAKRWLADTESLINEITAATKEDDIPPLGVLAMGGFTGTMR